MTTTAQPALQPLVDSQDLHQQLDRALREPGANLQTNQRLMEAVEAQILTGEATEELKLKARFLSALSKTHRNLLEDSLQEVNALLGDTQKETYPVLSFRAQSLRCALLLLLGNIDLSLSEFDVLLAGDLTMIPRLFVNRTRINYAKGLQDSGRTGEALERYESIMDQALDSENFTLALHAGIHFVSVLLELNDRRSARLVLLELKTAMERNPDHLAAVTLHLRELELMWLESDLAGARDGLLEVIDSSRLTTPALKSTANRLLAEVLTDIGETTQALQSAKLGLSLVGDHSLNKELAVLTLGRVYLRLGDYAAALETLEQLDPNEMVPLRRSTLRGLQLEAKMLVEGERENASLLTEMLTASTAHQDDVSKASLDYRTNRLVTVRRIAQLEAAEARADFLQEVNAADRRVYRTLVMLALAFAAIVCLGIYIVFRSRTEQQRHTIQQSQNERLASLVEQRTTELSETLETRAKMARALEQKQHIEAIGLLAGNVAHDMNNLLQVISSVNSILQESALEPNERKVLIGLSDESIENGAGIIRQLLIYARKQELSTEYLILGDYLRESRRLLQTALGDRIQLKIVCDRGDAALHTDRSLLTTSLLNILGNAADAMPSGGVATLTAALIDREQLEEPWPDLPPGAHVSFSVHDTGSGMSSETSSRIFEPFFSTKGSHGTGLGLSSVHGFVHQSEGVIRVRSELGVGTTIELALPAADKADVAKELPKSSDVEIEGRRLLLVEDNEAVAGSMTPMLEALGLRTEWAASGYAAQVILREDSAFDYVLSDVKMPGTLDGYALAAWVNDHYPGISVVLMTGIDQTGDGRTEVPVLTKPIGLLQIKEILATSQHADSL